ncbi:MAG: 3-keto-5-aminohexanoate cleavage protein [Pseudomonadota bacterium]
MSGANSGGMGADRPPPLPRIMVAPNGARLGKADHPQLPLTIAEIAETAAACHAAGAGAIHAHLRDEDGQHLLDTARYRDLIAAIEAAAPGLAVQITTEAVGRYPPETQMRVALESGARMVSVSTREISRAGARSALAFFERCAAEGVAVQHILYDRADGERLAAILPSAALGAPDLQLLFVLGRYGAAPARPADLHPFLAWMAERTLHPDWAACAFGPDEVPCLLHAAAQGGKCRTGFENALHLSTGALAPDNAAKVADLAQALRKGRPRSGN